MWGDKIIFKATISNAMILLTIVFSTYPAYAITASDADQLERASASITLRHSFGGDYVDAMADMYLQHRENVWKKLFVASLIAKSEVKGEVPDEILEQYKLNPKDVKLINEKILEMKEAYRKYFMKDRAHGRIKDAMIDVVIDMRKSGDIKLLAGQPNPKKTSVPVIDRLVEKLVDRVGEAIDSSLEEQIKDHLTDYIVESQSQSA